MKHIVDPVKCCGLRQTADIDDPSALRSSSHIVGIGLRGACPHGLKCWLYFPEDDCPFYRTTVFSHYAPNNCPPPDAALPTLCLVSLLTSALAFFHSSVTSGSCAGMPSASRHLIALPSTQLELCAHGNAGEDDGPQTRSPSWPLGAVHVARAMRTPAAPAASRSRAPTGASCSR